jgi:hypothetical protein
MLIDVFSNKLYISNKDEIVGLDIKNACREIYSVWNSIPI